MGAIAMGISPVFVRLAEVGPFASAFWRVGLAVPVMLLWWLLARRKAANRSPEARRAARPFVLLAGLLFAGDLFFWHLAIVNTTVANATLMATLAPIWVLLLAGLVLGEPVGRREIGGLGLCLAGGLLLVGASWQFSPERLEGDLYGLVTSMFFGGYFLCVRRARRGASSAQIMAVSGLVTAALLLIAALMLEPTLLPASSKGLAALVALALVSHIGGQGLLAFSLGHLPAAFSSLVIFLEAVAAALFGIVLLGEALGPAQWVGGALILTGVFVARERRSRRTADLVQ
ncbi:MAG: DMT family transporter [Hyphomicrobiaceae bacterium]|nr:DMT family transporter [Hyphomicrobiaceae bacterium]